MPSGLDDAVRAYQLPTTAPAQVVLSQYNLSSNTPIYITPGIGSSGAGPLPPIQTGGAHYDITITHYCEQASVEAREETEGGG